MTNDFYAKKDLWTTKQQFTIKKDDWKETLFKELYASQIQKELEKYIRMLMQCKAMLEDNVVVVELIDEITEFKNTNQVVEYLKSPYLRDRHFEKINEAIGEGEHFFSPDSEEITLGKLLEIKLVEKRSKIGEIQL